MLVPTFRVSVFGSPHVLPNRKHFFKKLRLLRKSFPVLRTKFSHTWIEAGSLWFLKKYIFIKTKRFIYSLFDDQDRQFSGVHALILLSCPNFKIVKRMLLTQKIVKFLFSVILIECCKLICDAHDIEILYSMIFFA